MTKLNVEALLAKNPQVDRKLLEENRKKIEEAQKLSGQKKELPVAPPFGGRRLVPDDAAIDRSRTIKHPRYRGGAE